MILDFTAPQRPPLSTFFRRRVDRRGRPRPYAGQPDAYEYLSRSVRRYPGPAEIAALMDGCGMTGIRWIVTGGGIVTLHVGTVRP